MYDKIYSKTCVTSNNSDQPVHPSSIARVLVYPTVDSPDAKVYAISEDSDQTAWMHRLIGVFAGRTSLTVGFDLP